MAISEVEALRSVRGRGRSADPTTWQGRFRRRSRQCCTAEAQEQMGGPTSGRTWTSCRSDFTLYVLDLPQFGRKSDKPHVAENRLSFWSDCLTAFPG